jgi:hypothetical protein
MLNWDRTKGYYLSLITKEFQIYINKSFFPSDTDSKWRVYIHYTMEGNYKSSFTCLFDEEDEEILKLKALLKAKSLGIDIKKII